MKVCLTRIHSLLVASVLLMAASSCGKEVLPQEGKLCVRVIYPVSGFGDGGYVDGIYRGVCISGRTFPGLIVENYCPESIRHAEGAIEDWLYPSEDDRQFSRRLLILADGSHTDILRSHPEWKIPKNGTILLLDSTDPLPSHWKNVCTRMVCGYGASYLAGIVASACGFSSSAVVCANPVHSAVHELCKGFIDGFRSDGGELDDEDVYYLASDAFEGFDKADQLFRLANELDKKYKFVFPVCGGSSQGLYRYTREFPDSFSTCGIDSDMQAYSDHVIFSIEKRMDLMVEDAINEWVTESKLGQNVVLGLSSGYIRVEFSDWFKKSDSIIESAYSRGLDAEKEYLGI